MLINAIDSNDFNDLSTLVLKIQEQYSIFTALFRIRLAGTTRGFR